MKKFVAATFFAMSTFAVPAVFVATPASAVTCGVDAPAEWERPGGYCDALKSTNSLSSPVEGQPPAATSIPCAADVPEMLRLLRDLNIGERIQVAAGCPLD